MLSVDISDNFEDVAAKFQQAGNEAVREIDRNLMEKIGHRIAAVAQAIASEHNPSIKISVRRGDGFIEVIGSSGGSPIAVLESFGNRGKRQGLDSWRHPVYGNREVWVSQKKHKFLQPALTANRPWIRIQMQGTLAEALMKQGFEVI